MHLNDTESGYPSLCHPINHNGLLPFHPQNMDLPEITVSNMLGQDGTMLSNSLSVVSLLIAYVFVCMDICRHVYMYLRKIFETYGFQNKCTISNLIRIL